jgi:hypothetical protein
MNFRILNLIEPHVLLMRDRNEMGDESVRMIAWDDSEDLIYEEEVIFKNAETAKRYISDFSEKAGIEFLERNNLY